MCPEQDSNLHVSQHSHLKRARLPFRHLGNYLWAENEARTRDPNLGKVVLYQLSYFRVSANLLFSITYSCQGCVPYYFAARLCSTNWTILAFLRICFLVSHILAKVVYLIILRQGCALPTELFPRFCETRHFRLCSLRESKLSHSLARKFRIVFRLTGAKVVLFFKLAKLFECFFMIICANEQMSSLIVNITFLCLKIL